jgi:hypothetical protein
MVLGGTAVLIVALVLLSRDIDLAGNAGYGVPIVFPEQVVSNELQ